MPDMNKKTILVVDDDHEIVRAITITLEREGYHVLNAYDGLVNLRIVLALWRETVSGQTAHPVYPSHRNPTIEA